MPQFGHQNGFDTVTIITGPSHVFLGIRFGDGPLRLIKRPPVGDRRQGKLDESQIINAIMTGLAAANTETRAAISAAVACCFEDDSPRYDLFTRCAYLLALRKA